MKSGVTSAPLHYTPCRTGSPDAKRGDGRATVPFRHVRLLRCQQASRQRQGCLRHSIFINPHIFFAVTLPYVFPPSCGCRFASPVIVLPATLMTTVPELSPQRSSLFL